MVHWYLKQAGKVTGPLSESSVRDHLLKQPIRAGDEVRQGKSEWKDARKAKELFVSLVQRGWMIKAGDRELGPFTAEKLIFLGNAGLIGDKTPVRQGDQAAWTPYANAKETTLSHLITATQRPVEEEDAQGQPKTENENDRRPRLRGAHLRGESATVPQVLLPSQARLAMPLSALSVTLAKLFLLGLWVLAVGIVSIAALLVASRLGIAEHRASDGRVEIRPLSGLPVDPLGMDSGIP